MSVEYEMQYTAAIMGSREEFAVALAMLAACPAAAESGVPCGDCRACRQLENGSYPELYHLFLLLSNHDTESSDSNSL